MRCWCAIWLMLASQCGAYCVLKMDCTWGGLNDYDMIAPVLVGIITGLLSAFLAYQIDCLFDRFINSNNERLMDDLIANTERQDGNRLDPPRDFWRSMLQVIDFYGTLFAHCLKTEGGSKRLRLTCNNSKTIANNAYPIRVIGLFCRSGFQKVFHRWGWQYWYNS